jgi:hypothetical protein
MIGKGYQKVKIGESVSLKYENTENKNEIKWIKYKITDVKELSKDLTSPVFENKMKYHIINISLEEVKSDIKKEAL